MPHPVPVAYANHGSQHGTESCVRHSQSATLGAFAGIYSKMAGCIMWVFLPDYRYKTKTPNHRLPPPLSSMITCSKDPMTKCTAQLFRLF